MANTGSSNRTRPGRRPILGWLTVLCIVILGALNNWLAFRDFRDFKGREEQHAKHRTSEVARKAREAIVSGEAAPEQIGQALPKEVGQAHILNDQGTVVQSFKASGSSARKSYRSLAKSVRHLEAGRKEKDLFVSERYRDTEGNHMRLAYAQLPSGELAELVFFEEPPKIVSGLWNRVLVSVATNIVLTLGLVTITIYYIQKPVRDLGKSLSKAELYNHCILDSMSGGVITVDMRGTITTFNATAEKMLGIPESDVKGKKLSVAFPAQGGLGNVIMRTLRGQARYCRYELEVPASGNRKVFLAVSSTMLKDQDGETIGATLFFDDLTETKRLRKEVALKERLAALGELSAGMAHEIRNPLGGIQLMAGLLKRKLPDREDLATLVQDIITEVKVLERIVAEFLDFARPPKLEPTPSKIAEISDQALALCGRLFEDAEATVKRRYHVPAEQAYLLDGEQIKRVLLNLFRNAAQAMDRGGELTVTINEQQGRAMGGVAQQRWLEIEVANTGPAIPPEHIDKIFNPFFSTKETGTGIGLAIVHKVVENHGGSISVDSSPDTGTSFRIALPASGAPA